MPLTIMGSWFVAHFAESASERVVEKLIAAFVVCCIGGIVLRARIRAMIAPSGEVLASDERELAEVLCESNISIRGFTVAKSAKEGRLILSSKRLVFCSHDKKRVGLSVSSDRVSEITSRNGLFGNRPTIEVRYSDEKGRRKTASFHIPARVSASSTLSATMTGGDVVIRNQSRDEFLAHLVAWARASDHATGTG